MKRPSNETQMEPNITIIWELSISSWWNGKEPNKISINVSKKTLTMWKLMARREIATIHSKNSTKHYKHMKKDWKSTLKTKYVRVVFKKPKQQSTLDQEVLRNSNNKELRKLWQIPKFKLFWIPPKWEMLWMIYRVTQQQSRTSWRTLHWHKKLKNWFKQVSLVWADCWLISK